MKKIVLLIAASILLGTALSCQKESAAPAADDQLVQVSLVAALPDGPATRSALDDGSAIDQLDVLVYHKDGENLVYKAALTPQAKSIQFDKTKLQFTIHLSLLKQKTYEVVLVARSQESNSYFTLNTDTHKLTVGAMPLNEAKADLFWNHQEVQPAEDKAQQKYSLQLGRPFAQVNLLANVPTEASYTVALDIEDVYKTMDLVTGALEGEKEKASFAAAAPNAAKLTDAKDENVQAATWIASAFVLAGTTEEPLTKVSWTVNREGEDPVAGSTEGAAEQPVIQRNKRTNILIDSILPIVNQDPE